MSNGEVAIWNNLVDCELGLYPTSLVIFAAATACPSQRELFPRLNDCARPKPNQFAALSLLIPGSSRC